PPIHGHLSEHSSGPVIRKESNDRNRQNEQQSAQSTVYERQLLFGNDADPLFISTSQLPFITDTAIQRSKRPAVGSVSSCRFQLGHGLLMSASAAPCIVNWSWLILR